MTSLNNFSRRMELRADQLGLSVDQVVRKVALVVDQIVVLATPVDTGRARSNWLVSTGSPLGRVIAPYSPGSRLGVSEGENARAALDQARRAVALRKTEQPIYIVNNVDYMPLLNNGSSTQAPKNFVATSVQQGVAAVRGVRIFS